jgi:hypothetical protein
MLNKRWHVTKPKIKGSTMCLINIIIGHAVNMVKH